MSKPLPTMRPCSTEPLQMAKHSNLKCINISTTVLVKVKLNPFLHTTCLDKYDINFLLIFLYLENFIDASTFIHNTKFPSHSLGQVEHSAR